MHHTVCLVGQRVARCIHHARDMLMCSCAHMLICLVTHCSFTLLNIIFALSGGLLTALGPHLSHEECECHCLSLTCWNHRYVQGVMHFGDHGSIVT